MIISRLFGGLGNQLFQYATARALADARDTPLVLDTRLAPDGNHWAYGLHHFNIRADIGQPTQLPPGKDQRLRYLLWRNFSKNPRMIREKTLAYRPKQFPPTGDLYLHGYFQSEAYFNAIESQLRRDLSFVSKPEGLNAKVLENIHTNPSVSVHLRRGDYVSNANNTHGTCDAAYYDRALDLIAEHTNSEPVAFVFSDDPDWARDNMSLRFETVFVGHNGFDQAHEDLRLMSHCTHNVIANSTFSWWGAWLNSNAGKCVVAPTQWFNTPKLNNPDLIPKTWLRC